MSIPGIKYGMECVDKMECVWTEMNEGFERACGRKSFCKLTLPVGKLETNFEKAELHMCKNTNVSTILQINK